MTEKVLFCDTLRLIILCDKVINHSFPDEGTMEFLAMPTVFFVKSGGKAPEQ